MAKTATKTSAKATPKTATKTPTKGAVKASNAKAKASAKDDDEDEDDTPKVGRGRKGGQLGKSIAETWIHIFETNGQLADKDLKSVKLGGIVYKRPLTDEQIAEFMEGEFEGKCKEAIPEAVTRIRSMYNRGQLRPQQGETPDRVVGSFDEDGEETVRHRGSRAEAAKSAKKNVTKKKVANSKTKVEVEDDEDDEEEEEEPTPKKKVKKAAAKVIVKKK